MKRKKPPYTSSLAFAFHLGLTHQRAKEYASQQLAELLCQIPQINVMSSVLMSFSLTICLLLSRPFHTLNPRRRSSESGSNFGHFRCARGCGCVCVCVCVCVFVCVHLVYPLAVSTYWFIHSPCSHGQRERVCKIVLSWLMWQHVTQMLSKKPL